MNQLYEQLFTTFSEKAQIKQEATQITHTLKTAYPNCHLPVPKTIKRVLAGETAHPRDTLLGFLSAFILDKTEADVLEADKRNKLGEFYKIYLEQMSSQAIAYPPNVASMSTIKSSGDSKPQNAQKQIEQTKTRLIWVLWAVVLLLVGYIFFSKKTMKQPLGSISPNIVKVN